jgi:hypothetical protein
MTMQPMQREKNVSSAMRTFSFQLESLHCYAYSRAILYWLHTLTQNISAHSEFLNPLKNDLLRKIFHQTLIFVDNCHAQTNGVYRV